MTSETLQQEINLSQAQLAKLEQMAKQRSFRIEQRRSLADKRSSIKLKNLNRQNSLLSKEELNMIQTLSGYFENAEANMEQIDDFCEKKQIYYLLQLKNKMPYEQYKSFLSNLQLFRVPEGIRLQQEGKFHNYHYIIVQGNVAAFHQRKIKDEEKEYLQMFQYETGEAVMSNLLQTHKANPYTIKTKRSSLLLRFNDESFVKYLKKIWLKQMDEFASLLSHTLIFKSIPTPEIKKFLPYCSIRRFKYNQLVYQEGDLIKQLLLIVEGEVQISYDREDNNRHNTSKGSLASLTPQNFYKANHQSSDKKEIRIVRVGKKQLFGLEAYQVFNENYYQNHSRVTSDTLKTLAIGLNVLYDMEIENPILEENLNSYLTKINQIHNKLLEKSQNINLNAPQQKKKKRKKKLRRRPQNSLEWWGLAAKIEDSKKYRLPTPPAKSQSSKHLTRKQPLQFAQRTSKLDYFKRRLFEDQMETLEAINQKQNSVGAHTGGLVPKLQKMKIKMLNTKPKVINNAERVKRKLLDYAKNGEVFCDKLQLE